MSIILYVSAHSHSVEVFEVFAGDMRVRDKDPPQIELLAIELECVERHLTNLRCHVIDVVFGADTRNLVSELENRLFGGELDHFAAPISTE